MIFTFKLDLFFVLMGLVLMGLVLMGLVLMGLVLMGLVLMGLIITLRQKSYGAIMKLYLILGITGLVFSSPAVSCPSAFENNFIKELKLISKEDFLKKAEEFSSLDRFINQMALTLEMSQTDIKSFIVEAMGFAQKEEFIKDIMKKKGIRSQAEWLKALAKNLKLGDYYVANPQKMYPNFIWPEKEHWSNDGVSTYLGALPMDNKKKHGRGALKRLLEDDIFKEAMKKVKEEKAKKQRQVLKYTKIDPIISESIKRAWDRVIKQIEERENLPRDEKIKRTIEKMEEVFKQAMSHGEFKTIMNKVYKEIKKPEFLSKGEKEQQVALRDFVERLLNELEEKKSGRWTRENRGLRPPSPPDTWGI